MKSPGLFVSFGNWVFAYIEFNCHSDCVTCLKVSESFYGAALIDLSS